MPINFNNFLAISRAETARFEGGSQILRPRTEDSLHLENRN